MGSAPSASLQDARGWYGPPNSRRYHYFGVTPDGRSLCGKWVVFAWSSVLVDRAYGPANGDCVACKRKLADIDAVDSASSSEVSN